MEKKPLIIITHPYVVPSNMTDIFSVGGKKSDILATFTLQALMLNSDLLLRSNFFV